MSKLKLSKLNALITSLAIFISILLLLPDKTRAGNGLISYNNNMNIKETSETAVIIYNGSQESLYLKLNYEGSSDNFIWIIPVPSYPQTSVIGNNIFEDISLLTSGLNNSWQKDISTYNPMIFSSNKEEGLIEWLEENNYNLSLEEKSNLEWYINKNWYFVVVALSQNTKINDAINELNKIDSSAAKSNMIDKLSSIYISSFKNNDFEKFKRIVNILINLQVNDSIRLREFNQEEFLRLAESTKDYQEEEWNEAENELKSEWEEEIKKLETKNINQYNGVLGPIKIDFSSDKIIYPLRLSQISIKNTDDLDLTETNTIHLYVLADKEVKAPEFHIIYNEKINSEILTKQNNLSALKEIITKEYFLTELSKNYSKDEINEDLILSNDTNIKTSTSAEIERDKQRLENIEEIQASLEIFSWDNGKYPDKIASGLSIKGNNNEIYMDTVPSNPEPGGIQYNYTVQKDKKNYKLKFKLEVGVDDYPKGLCIATKDEITCNEENTSPDSNLLPARAGSLFDRLKGRILIKVEEAGKAYYVNPANKTKSYLGRPQDAFKVMREQGSGISNANLLKIPLALDNLSGLDTDKDGLPDAFENAIGTNKNEKDTDKDGYEDKIELSSGYSPLIKGAKLLIDEKFTNVHKGKIFLQVEKKGEAWYVNPANGKRYFLGRPTDAFNIMRLLGSGISNYDFLRL